MRIHIPQLKFIIIRDEFVKIIEDQRFNWESIFITQVQNKAGYNKDGFK